MGELYRRTGDLDKARTILEQALQINENAREKGHPLVAECVHSLALLAHADGRLADSDSLHQRCLETRKSTFGENSREVVECLEGYASLLRETGRASEAITLETKAMRIRSSHDLEMPQPDSTVSTESGRRN